MEAVVHRIPSPGSQVSAPLRALIFDSKYDPYKGVVAYVRVFDGTLRDGDTIRLFSNQKAFETMEVGYFRLDMIAAKVLSARRR